jgi:hypothetical protein
MKTIQSNQKLTSRSICDHNCIFELLVIERKGNFAVINYFGNIKRTKIYKDSDNNEYLMPEKYSMAPIFTAII